MQFGSSLHNMIILSQVLAPRGDSRIIFGKTSISCTTSVERMWGALCNISWGKKKANIREQCRHAEELIKKLVEELALARS